MKTTLSFFSLMVIAAIAFGQTSTFYDFKVKAIDGTDYDLSELKGKKVLVVNTASKCGLTPQYTDLQKLYETYGGGNFIIIGFPANNFMSQEPGSNSDIKSFCTQNYGVTFPMMEKISVKGKDIHPLYKWLTNKSENGVMDAEVSWNFQKFMIDENGKLVDFASPKEKPQSEKIINWIKK
ncbi:glutathione peroxidase [Williamwhitmania taraxaci]|uniref:Glutathione peroxidase n=1 Tax=Williamwhitmania taraxaci TaxID=1640674 RepID=A0A1G6HVF8_9BACT|nr:glutathione peroxidase [Williamwhitmania taraxaci]